MIYLLIDYLSLNIFNVHLSLYLYKLQNISLIDFILCSIFIYVLSPDILLITIMILIYSLNKIVYRYVYDRLIIKLSLFTFSYLIIYDFIDYGYFISMIFVIILEISKYNNIGDMFVNKKKSNDLSY